MKKTQPRSPYCCADFPIADQRSQDTASMLKALAHPARLQILQQLGLHAQCCCNDFCENLPLAQSTISQHLKILSDAGFIEYLPNGNYSHYSLVNNRLGEVIGILNEIHEFVDREQEESSADVNPDN